jgi:hypothetical protein
VGTANMHFRKKRPEIARKQQLKYGSSQMAGMVMPATMAPS